MKTIEEERDEEVRNICKNGGTIKLNHEQLDSDENDSREMANSKKERTMDRRSWWSQRTDRLLM